MTPAPAADEARHARHRAEVNDTTPGFWRALWDWLCADTPWI